jgi:hypothetical protein
MIYTTRGPIGSYTAEFATHNSHILTDSLYNYCTDKCQYYRAFNENPTPPGTYSTGPTGGPIDIYLDNRPGGDPDLHGGD